MGDIADDILDGIYCEMCGEYLGDACGYPRTCNACSELLGDEDFEPYVEHEDD
jgi:hypothetical protein